MAVFGRCPRLASEMMSDDALSQTPHMNVSEHARYSDLVRLESLKAFHEFDAKTAVQTSMNRQMANNDVYEYAPGDRVAFFRENTKHGANKGPGSKTKRSAYLIGTYLNKQPDSKGGNLFIEFSGRQFVVAPQNCRPAVGHEMDTFAPSAEEIATMKNAEATIRAREYQQHVGEAPPTREEDRDPNIILPPSLGGFDGGLAPPVMNPDVARSSQPQLSLSPALPENQRASSSRSRSRRGSGASSVPSLPSRRSSLLDPAGSPSAEASADGSGSSSSSSSSHGEENAASQSSQTLV